MQSKNQYNASNAQTFLWFCSNSVCMYLPCVSKYNLANRNSGWMHDSMSRPINEKFIIYVCTYTDFFSIDDSVIQMDSVDNCYN